MTITESGSSTSALAALERDATAPLLAQLLAIPSVTGTAAESLAQHLLADWYADAGLDVDMWPIDLDAVTSSPGFPGMEAPRAEGWGLVGTWAGPLGGDRGGPTLVLNGHVDVVPPGDLRRWSSEPFRPWIAAGADGREAMYGRGAVDMKAGLVAALLALRAVKAAGLPMRGQVQLQSVVGEEDGGLGAFATLQRGYRGDLAIIPEPTSCQIVCTNAGALTFRLIVQGRATHASSRKSGVSAIEALWPIWLALAALEERRNRDVHPLMAHLDPPYPLSIGTVRAGDWASSVPDILVAEGRLGVALGEDVAAAREELRHAVATACAGDSWLRDHPVEVEFFGGQYAPGYTDPDSLLVGMVSEAHRELTGLSPAVRGAPWGSDLRLFAAAGVPVLHYGPGAVHLAHAPDEHVPLAEVVQTAEVLVRLIVATCT